MDHHAAYSIGVAYAQMGKHEQAVKWLTRAVETGLPCYPWFEKDPLLDGMRGIPDFQRLMGNLKKYWGSVNRALRKPVRTYRSEQYAEFHVGAARY